MRIMISEFISLDGVVQAPGGAEEDTDNGFAHGGWSMPFFDPDTMGAAYAQAMEATEALLFGRRTWQTMAAAWPDRAGDPFADRMNSIPKYVASRTLSPGRSRLGQLDAARRRRRDRSRPQAQGASRRRPPRDGQFAARAATHRERPRRRVPADDRARHPRWGQAPLPRRHHPAITRTRQHHDEPDRRTHLHLPTHRTLTGIERRRTTMSVRSTPELILNDIAFGESPRWHRGRIWFCDWVDGDVVGVERDGSNRTTHPTSTGSRSALTGTSTGTS